MLKKEYTAYPCSMIVCQSRVPSEKEFPVLLPFKEVEEGLQLL